MYEGHEPIVVACDFSGDAEAALTYASDVADRLSRPLSVVHVVEIPAPMPTDRRGVGRPTTGYSIRQGRIGLNDIAERLAKTHPTVSVTTTLLVGDPAPALLERSSGAFVLVVGAWGTGGHPMARRGCVTDHLMSQAACPVLVTRSGSVAARNGPIIVVSDTPAHADVVTDFARTFSRGRPRYLVSVHPQRGGGVMRLAAGAVSLDELIVGIRPGTGDIDATVRQAATAYGAVLVVLARDRHVWPLCRGFSARVRDMAEMLDCPIAVVPSASPKPHAAPARHFSKWTTVRRQRAVLGENGFGPQPPIGRGGVRSPAELSTSTKTSSS